MMRPCFLSSHPKPITASMETSLHPQEEEVSELQWMEIHEAYEAVTFRNDKNLIAKAMDFIDRRGM